MGCAFGGAGCAGRCSRGLSSGGEYGIAAATDASAPRLPLRACRGWLQVDRSPDSKIDMQALLQTALEVAQAMAYLHSKDVIHADLTGNNVLLTKSAADKRGFMAMVGDFGLSRVASEGTMNTNTFGTVSHMPPELLADGTLTKAADVYAFGVLVWEMYNGTRAFVGRRAPTIIHAVTSGTGQLTMPDFAPADLKVGWGDPTAPWSG